MVKVKLEIDKITGLKSNDKLEEEVMNEFFNV